MEHPLTWASWAVHVQGKQIAHSGSAHWPKRARPKYFGLQPQRSLVVDFGHHHGTWKLQPLSCNGIIFNNTSSPLTSSLLDTLNIKQETNLDQSPLVISMARLFELQGNFMNV